MRQAAVEAREIMELICPSCEARYQVPDPSIGEKGRQVSCMSCGHSWHAFPPLVLGSSVAPPTTASPGIEYQGARPGRPAPNFVDVEPEEAPPPRAPEPTRLNDPSRSEQLAEIREMLAEVQSEERAAAALVPDDDAYRSRPAAEPAAAPVSEPLPQSQPPLGHLEDEGDDSTDPLRQRMAEHDRESQRRRANVEKLRRSHDRRARRSQRAQEAGSGAFLTGFLLIVMVGAVMTALYVLHPQIIARMPGTEPMLNEYVATVDGIRVSVAESLESAIDWLNGLIQDMA